MKIAAISLNNRGAKLAAALAALVDPVDVFLHATVTELSEARRFRRIARVDSRDFSECTRGWSTLRRSASWFGPSPPASATRRLIRRSSPWTSGRAGAVSLLSGHDGGANQLAMRGG